MKICLIANSSSVHIRKWASFLVKFGHDISIITDVNSQIDGVNTYYIGECIGLLKIPIISAILQIVCKVYKIKKILKQLRPDVINAHFATNYGYIAAKSNYHPFVLTCHGGDIIDDLNQKYIFRHFVLKALKKCDLITLPSDEMKYKIINEGIPIEKIFKIQFGIDITRFTFNNIYSTNHPIQIISTRYLIYEYRIDLVIHAFSNLLSSYDREITLIIIGNGPEKANLIDITNKLHIQSSVKFLSNIENNKLSRFYEQSQIYITSSPTDGLSISLLEAFATGSFPIVPENPSNGSVAKMGFNVAFFEINNIDSMTTALKDTIHSIKNSDNKLKQNRILVEKYFNINTNMAIIESLYQRTISDWERTIIK